MKTKIYKSNLSVLLIVSALMTLLPLTVIANNAGAENGQSGSTTSNGAGNSSVSAGSENGSSSGASQTKLQAGNLEKCKNRETVMNNVMSRVGDRGQKQIGAIDDIAAKVKTFYSANNISVGNYDDIVAGIEAKKVIAQNTMNNVRNMNGSFSCGNNDPKGLATQFKLQAASQSAAVSEYKNQVSDLVAAIKAAIVLTDQETDNN